MSNCICGHCDKKIQQHFDSYVPFGRSADTEFPEEVYLCFKCALNLQKDVESRCSTSKHVYINYSPAFVEYMGLIKYGYVIFKGEGCHPDCVPEGSIAENPQTILERIK